MLSTIVSATFRLPELTALWNQSVGFQHPTDRWTAYCNQLAIAVVIPFFREVFDSSAVRPVLAPIAQASQWSCVTGTMLQVGNLRWLVLPIEQVDEAEIAIPQEWLEIPDWQIDRIIAIQITPDDALASIAGFTDRFTLQTYGHYDPVTRTYALDRIHWIADIATLQVVEALTERPESSIAPTPLLSLPIAQAQNLIPRLAESVIPRLAIPFQTWAALIQNPGWRQQYHHHRQMGEAPRSVTQWLQSGLDAVAAELGWQPFNWAMAGTRGAGDRSAMPSAICKVLTIAGLRYEFRIVSGTEPGDWRFELQGLGGRIPAGLVLRLKTEDLQDFEGNEAIALEDLDSLWIDVTVEPGEALIWEIEPTPEEGDRELVRF